MKEGRSLQELAMELERQRQTKQDYLLDTRNLTMDCDKSLCRITIHNDEKHIDTMLDIGVIAHRQIGSTLGIPSRYYDKMREEYPGLLAQNVNSWFAHDPEVRMVRTLDGTMRAFLSDRYRIIDNAEIAEAVLPLIAELPDARVESCEVTEQRMYLKVVNPRLVSEVVPGDIVQSGIIITNSEVGLGCMKIQPLIYRLVCKNGMVVNEAATRRHHIGRINQSDEDYRIYSDETIAADNRALMLKVRDAVKAVTEEARFARVVKMMRDATEAKITTSNIPALVEITARDYGLRDAEQQSVLDYLIRGGDLSLYGLSNAVTQAAQDVPSYDRSTEMERIGYDILSMSGTTWNHMNIKTV